MPRVLLADDNRTSEQVVRLALEPENIEVHARTDWESAWTFLAEEGADVVLIDVGLPQIDGYEFCRRIRSGPTTAHLPVVLLGTVTSPVDAAQALICGCREWMTKPLDAGVLAGVVQRVLGESVKPVPGPDFEPIRLTRDECLAPPVWLPLNMKPAVPQPPPVRSAEPALDHTALDAKALAELLTANLKEALPELVRRALQSSAAPPAV